MNYSTHVMKKKLLLIDDIKEFRTLLKIFLSSKYEVVTAEDGLEALSILENGYTPDAIVTDLMMPRLDGYQLISRLKSGDSHNRVPIIVLSNVDKRKEREELLNKGVCGYIIKPFNPHELQEGLDRKISEALVWNN